MSDPLVGRVLLGRYRVVQPLAKGGMGVVYLARTEGAAGFLRPVVIKRILPDIEDKDAIAMFVREARILASLRHPNIAGIVDFAEEDGAHLMVLEYVHGYHVGQWRRYVREKRGPFDVELAVQVVLDVLEALAHAHRLERPDGKLAEVVHRDVSPSNVMVDAEGRVKLLDFGVARMTGGDTGLYKTETLMVKGKLPYVPPEQIGGSPPSPSGDVYASAVMLHELLVGGNELRGGDVAETVARVLSHVPRPLRSVRDDVPDALSAVVERALRKDPAERYATAHELAAALREARTLTSDQARARLAAQVREDYPAMPKAIGVEPLDARERAWKAPTDALVAASAPARSADPELPPTQAELPVPRSRGWGPWAVGGALMIAALIVAALAIVSTPWGGDDEPAEPLYVVQQPSPTESSDPPEREAEREPVPSAEIAPEPASDAPDRVDTLDAPEPVRTPRTARTSGATAPTPGEPLTASFARQGAEVERCLRAHAASIEGAPELAVHFQIERDGRVRSARVIPAAVDATLLGTCLRGVATRVRFAPQERDGVSFRIPITVEQR